MNVVENSFVENQQPDIFPSAFVHTYMQKTGERYLSYERIFHGRNNRAYRVQTSGKTYFLKVYFRHPLDSRDRLGAEFSFLEFCRDQNISKVPQPLACDRQTGVALYSWVDGEPVQAGRLNKDDIAHAADFLHALARASKTPQATSLPFASEACLCFEDHLLLAEKRVKRLQTALMESQDSEVVREARHFVEELLTPALHRAVNTVRSTVKPDILRRPLVPAELIVSPSDFGFHNALRTDKGIVFVDFEYAGLDDPVKTVCDFICQPEIPVDEEYIEVMSNSLEGLQAKKIEYYVKIFLTLHRIKWCCIIMNDFIKEDSLRRDYSWREKKIEKKLSIQISKVYKYMNLL